MFTNSRAEIDNSIDMNDFKLREWNELNNNCCIANSIYFKPIEAGGEISYFISKCKNTPPFMNDLWLNCF